MHVPAWPVLPSSTLAPDAIAAKFAARSLSGLGCGCSMIDEAGDCQDPEACPAPPTPTGDSSSVNLCSLYAMTPGCPGAPAVPPSTVPTVNVGGTTGYTVPAQNTQQWGILAAQLLRSGLTLAEIQSIQPGTVVSANGAILRQSTGLPVPVPTTSTTLGLAASPNTTTLLVAVLAIGAVMFVGGRR